MESTPITVITPSGLAQSWHKFVVTPEPTISADILLPAVCAAWGSAGFAWPMPAMQPAGDPDAAVEAAVRAVREFLPDANIRLTRDGEQVVVVVKSPAVTDFRDAKRQAFQRFVGASSAMDRERVTLIIERAA